MERISTHQFLTLGAAVLMGTTFLPVASIVTGVGGRDGWMSVLPAFALGIPYGLMVLSLVEQYPQNYLIFPFASLWILTLWGAAHWKKGAGV